MFEWVTEIWFRIYSVCIDGMGYVMCLHYYLDGHSQISFHMHNFVFSLSLEMLNIYYCPNIFLRTNYPLCIATYSIHIQYNRWSWDTCCSGSEWCRIYSMSTFKMLFSLIASKLYLQWRKVVYLHWWNKNMGI